MLNWISENFVTVLVAAIVAVLVVLAVIGIVRNKRKGNKCSCGCEGCVYSASCKSSGKKRPE